MKRLSLVLLLITSLATNVAAQSAEDLFQQALRVERVSGNTQAAIELYGQIVADHPTERFFVARALLQMGKAYEVLGEDGAREAYSRIIDEYGDFAAIASEAAERVAAFQVVAAPARPEEAAPGTRSLLRTHPDADSWGAALSRDGSVLATAVYGEERNGIALHDLETGAVTVTDLDMGDESPGSPELVALSPDGTKLAAGWYPGGGPMLTIRVRDLVSGEVSQVFDAADALSLLGLESPPTSRRNFHADAQHWTSDGSSLLVYFATPASDGLALAHLDGSSPTLITDLSGQDWALGACITSDDHYVFAALSDDRPFIGRIDVETGELVTWRRSSEHGVDLVGCVDDPIRVLFSEDFLGGKRLMSGQAGEIGAEAQIHATVPSNSAFGVPSGRGDVVYWPVSQWSDLTAAVDPESLDLASGLSTLGRVRESRWSPTDNRMAWYDAARSETVLWDADTGSRTILDNPSGANPWGFSADGRTLEMGDDAGLLFLDLETGDTRRIPEGFFENIGPRVSVDPDSSQYAYALSKPRKCLVRIDIRTEESTSFWCPDDGAVAGFLVSPDRSKILVRLSPEDDYREAVGRAVIDAQTATAQPILEHPKGPQGEQLRPQDWVGNDALFISGHSLEVNAFLITSLYVFNLETEELRPVLASLLDLATTGGRVRLSNDRRHVVAWGAPKDVGGDPTQATIIHRAVDVRLDR